MGTRFRLFLLLGLATFLSADEPSPAELLKQASDAYYKTKDNAAAEKLYRAAMDHPDASAAQKEEAHFYYAATLGNQERHADAVKAQQDWLKRYPKSSRRHYVLYFLGVYQQRAGDAKAARESWGIVVREAPDSEMAKHAREALGAPGKEAPPPAYEGDRVLPADAGKPGGYLVVCQSFRILAQEIATHHQAGFTAWDGKNYDALKATLARLKPRNVLFVVSPDVLDVAMHRRILLLSATLDADIFPDFAWGYFTARNVEAAQELWVRTKALLAKGLATNRWYATSVASTIKSTVYENSLPAIASAAGFSGKHFYYGSIEVDKQALDFARKTLRALQEADVITMTGCGDPQGTWLFSDKRNADRSKHWKYDPEKVGRDSKGEMPRITAALYKGVRLKSAICWTGVCHAGATRRVFVEGDIVSTFGRTDKTTVYDLKGNESYCLALLDAGAAAYLCPIGANHGMSVSREVDFALETGATLGETIKSTYDDVFLAARGKLVLEIPVEGEPHGRDGYVMQGGGSNRILIGDPALKPFRATPHPQEKVEITNRRENGFDVVVTWKEGFHARGWDMYGRGRARDWSIRARVDLDGLVPKGKELKISATVISGLPYVMEHSEPEVFHGRRYLHLQANAPRADVMRKAVRATFSVTWR